MISYDDGAGWRCSYLTETQTTNQKHPVKLTLTRGCKPIKCQQLNPFRHIDMIKITCWCSNWALEWGEKVIYVNFMNMSWLLPGRNWQSTIIFQHKHLLGCKRANIQWVATVTQMTNHDYNQGNAEEYVQMQMQNLDADGIQQQAIKPGDTPVS